MPNFLSVEHLLDKTLKLMQTWYEELRLKTCLILYFIYLIYSIDSDGDKTYNANQICDMVEFLIDNKQTQGNYYLWLTIAKIQRLESFIVKKFGQCLNALTVKLSVLKNKRTSHPEI